MSAKIQRALTKWVPCKEWKYVKKWSLKMWYSKTANKTRREIKIICRIIKRIFLNRWRTQQEKRQRKKTIMKIRKIRRF